MNIKVQSIVLKDKSESQVLSLMRKSIPAEFEYILHGEGSITRFSSETTGAIKPLVALDKLKEIDENLIDEDRDHLLILEESESLILCVTIRGSKITTVRPVLKEAYDLDAYSKMVIYCEEGLESIADNKCKFSIPKLTDKDLNATPHQFKNKEKIKIPSIAVGGAFILLIALIYALYPKSQPDIMEEKEKIVPVKQVKTVAMDRFHEYKTMLEGEVMYEEMSNALIAATLLSTKLPTGWVIEEVIGNKNGVTAKIINRNGRVQPLKHLRGVSGYTEYIDIDGQHAEFSYPIEPQNWYAWTQNITSFEAVRDDFLDEMILMDGNIRSDMPVHQRNFTYQQVGVTFEHASLAYLDLLNTILSKKPIFITDLKITLRSHSTNASENGAISFNAFIIGR
ncbi:hypothetical protein M3914_003120 [Vibrio metschnikovii]|nr:hypothetical protein [Vibrio metschnikovii]